MYGFRVRKTMEHPEIWYPVNQYGGKWLFAASLCLIVASIALRLVPGIALETYSLAVLAIWVIVFGIALFASICNLNSY
ncbi:MAG TPA: SdpI family protein [Anaerolineales bacterium]